MATFFYHQKPIIGFDISKTSIKVMSVDPTKMLVHGYGSIDLDPTKTDDEGEDSQAYLAERIRDLLQHRIVGRLDSDRAVVGIPAARTFARAFTLPADQEAGLTDAVNLEAEQYIPMPLDSLYIDHQIIKRTKQELTVLMCAVPKVFVDGIMAATTAGGLEVAMIEPSVNAVARLLKTTEEGSLPTIIIDIGPANADIAVLDGAVRVTGGLSIGGNTLTLDIAKKLDIPLETAHQFKVLSGLNAGPRQAKITSALRPSLMRIVAEVQKVMRYYVDRSPQEAKLEQVLIVGSGSNVPGLGEFFTNELVMPVRVASPWQVLNFDALKPPAKQLRPRYITAAGLSLVNPREIWQ